MSCPCGLVLISGSIEVLTVKEMVALQQKLNEYKARQTP